MNNNTPRGSGRQRSEETLTRMLPARITERDRAISHTLYEHRVLTTGQLAELHFDSIERARKRLAQLHQLGVLDRFRPYRQHGSHPCHYLLDRHGAQLIAAERGRELADLDWSRTRTLRLASSIQLRHLVETNGLVTRLAHALRDLPGCALVSWWGQRRCAQAWGELVRPDSYLRLKLPGGELELWVEYDRGSEQHARLQDKLDRYQELALALERRMTLLLVLQTDRREHEVHRTLRPPEEVLLLTGVASRHQQDPLAANWLAHDAQRRVSLHQLATKASSDVDSHAPARSI